MATSTINGYTVSAAAEHTGWSPRMLRYLEEQQLVVPRRTEAGYRVYGLRELNQLRTLLDLRTRHGVDLEQLAFASRLRRDPDVRAAVDTWLAAADDRSWIEWEQRKHERLLQVA